MSNKTIAKSRQQLPRRSLLLSILVLLTFCSFPGSSLAREMSEQDKEDKKASKYVTNPETKIMSYADQLSCLIYHNLTLYDFRGL